MRITEGFGTVAGMASAIEHPGGTTDGLVELGNNDVQYSGLKRVELWDRPGGTLLQTAYIAWGFESRTVGLMTEQPGSWSEVPRTVPETDIRASLQPGLGVSAQGRVLFVSYVSPHPQALVQVVRADDRNVYPQPVGLAASELIDHAGGTLQGGAQLAVRGDLPPGPLALQLLDKPYGTVLRTIELGWDGTNLTVADGAAGASDAQERVLLATAGGLRPDIEQIQRLNLYEWSAYHIHGGEEFMALLYDAFPAIFPADFDAAVTARWQADPTYSRGWHQEQLITAQRFKESEYRTHLNNYETAMSELLLKAVQFWADLKNGAAEQPLRDALRAAYDRTDVGGMAGLGIGKPSLAAIEAEGRRLYAQRYGYLLQVQSDNAQALIVDVNRAQLAGQRQELVAELATRIGRVLTRLSDADLSVAVAIRELAGVDDQLAYHWAEEMVPVDGPAAVTDDELDLFLASRLDTALEVLSVAGPDGVERAPIVNTYLVALAGGQTDWTSVSLYQRDSAQQVAPGTPATAAQLRRELADLWALHKGLVQARQEIVQQFSGIHSDIERRAASAKIASLLVGTWQRLGSLMANAVKNVPISGVSAVEDFVVTPVIEALDAAGYLGNAISGKAISTGLAIDGLIQGATSSSPLSLAVVVGGLIQEDIIGGYHVWMDYQQLAALNQITAAINRLNAAIAKRLPLLDQATRGTP